MAGSVVWLAVVVALVAVSCDGTSFIRFGKSATRLGPQAARLTPHATRATALRLTPQIAPVLTRDLRTSHPTQQLFVALGKPVDPNPHGFGIPFKQQMKGPRLFVRPHHVKPRPNYTPLSKEKVERYFQEQAKREGIPLGCSRESIVVSHGEGEVRVGMVLEGTAAWRGILPDIVVDEEAKTIVDRAVRRQAALMPTATTNDLITAAEKAIRVIIANTDMQDFSDFCVSDLDVLDAVKYDSHLPLSYFLHRGFGDCRINALALGLALSHVNGITDVKYSNRKWGSTTTPEEEAVGQQGEHAVMQFRYKEDTSIRVVADAFDVRYDRVPLDGALGVLQQASWYHVIDTRVVGKHHNPWKDLYVDGTFASFLRDRMWPRSRARFEQMAGMLDKETPEYSYLNRHENFPTAMVPDER